MYVFILIILIAELIIAFAIVSCIIKADRKVETIILKIEENNQNWQDKLKIIHNGAQKLFADVKRYFAILKESKERYLINLIKNIIVAIAIMVLKGKNKKFLAALELAVSLRNFLACK